MSGWFGYMGRKVIDKVFGATDFTPPATLYAAASTTTPNADGTGVTEPVGASYARVAVTNNTTNFPNAAGSPGSKTNGTAITFPAASGSWGTITHIAFYDASSGGNPVGFGALGTSKAVASADTLNIAIGALTITAA